MARSDLVVSVADDLVRDDLPANRVNEWIKGAEFRMNRMLRVGEMLKHATLPVDGKVFPLPPDFAGHSTLEVVQATDTPNVLGPRSGRFQYCPPDQLDENARRAGMSDEFGPRWFTIRGSEIELASYRSTARYQLDLHYFAKLKPLVADSDTNWLLESAPHIYTNAVEIFAYKWTQEPEKSAQCEASMVAEITALNDLYEEEKAGKGPLIMSRARKMGGRFS